MLIAGTAPKLGNIAARLRGVRKIHDLDERFREMDQFGDYKQVVSLPNPPIEDFATPGQGLALARVANDAMAELCGKYPERFAGFVAALCLTDVMGSVAEAKRAISEGRPYSVARRCTRGTSLATCTGTSETNATRCCLSSTTVSGTTLRGTPPRPARLRPG